MAQNQVLQGVQDRIKARLDEDLKADTANRTAQAQGLHGVIWSTDPSVTDDQRQRAQDALDKLYPHSKDLMGKVREVSGKLMSFLKPPPQVKDQAKEKSGQILQQADQRESTFEPDPAAAQTMPGMLPPPPIQAQPQAQTPPAVASPGGLVPPPAPQAQVQTQAPLQATPPYQASSTMPRPSISPSVPPPPTTAQDMGQIARTSAARKTQEEIDKEQRQAGTARETTRIAGVQGLGNAKDLAKFNKELEQTYGEHWVANTKFVLNQQTGEFKQLPPGAVADNSMTVPEIAMIAADPKDPRQAQAAKALELIEQGKPESYQRVFAGGQVVYVPKAMMNLPQAELDRMAKAGAFPSVAQTVYSQEGLPSVGGQAGISTQAPPTIAGETTAALADMRTTISIYENQILPNLEAAKDWLGPIAGRIKLGEASLAGGYGATPEQVKLLVAMETAMMTEAFANGGKNLTDTEKGYFERIRPKPGELFSNALTKAEAAVEFLRLREGERVATMPVNQRRTVPPISPPPAKPGQAGQEPEARNVNGVIYYKDPAAPPGKEWSTVKPGGAR